MLVGLREGVWVVGVEGVLALWLWEVDEALEWVSECVIESLAPGPGLLVKASASTVFA